MFRAIYQALAHTHTLVVSGAGASVAAVTAAISANPGVALIVIGALTLSVVGVVGYDKWWWVNEQRRRQQSDAENSHALETRTNRLQSEINRLRAENNNKELALEQLRLQLQVYTQNLTAANARHTVEAQERERLEQALSASEERLCEVAQHYDELSMRSGSVSTSIFSIINRMKDCVLDSSEAIAELSEIANELNPSQP